MSTFGTSVLPPHQQGLFDAVKLLWKSKEGADLTLICGDERKSIRVHSVIVCPRSEFFKAACKGGFKESHTHEIELPDDFFASVWRMLCFLYGLDYSSNRSDNDDVWICAAHINVLVYHLADKYGIEGLQSHATAKFRTAIEQDLSAKVLGVPVSKDGCEKAMTEVMEGFKETVTTVYATISDSDQILRDILADFTYKNWIFIRSLPLIAECFVAHPKFAIDCMDRQQTGLTARNSMRNQQRHR